MTTHDTPQTLRLDGRVAIVTGAGVGLGRAHALALAARGARVVVNDLGTARDGGAVGASPADAVVADIVAAGGQAMASRCSVTDEAGVRAMVTEVVAAWGRVDILVNNAGILRDKSFSKMTLDEFRSVVEVHLMGSVIMTQAVWDIMKAQKHGRIVFTTSSSGLFGNFGQANYAAAKMALVGLMQTLAQEGDKYNVRVNCLAPTAATRMTSDVMPPEMLAMLTPESVSPAVVFLASDAAPTRAIVNAGAGVFSTSHVTLSPGVLLGSGPHVADELAARWAEVSSREGDRVPEGGMQQSQQEVARAVQG